MDMITWLQHWLEKDDTKLLYVLCIILVVSVLDMSVGWINAKFNKEVVFSSSIALFGVMKKIVYFSGLVLFIPIALIFPSSFSIPALYLLYFAYLYTELTSLFSHFKLSNDDKQQELFIDFINKLFKKK